MSEMYGAWYLTHTAAYVSTRQHTSAYVSIRQHTSEMYGAEYLTHTAAYVRIRQHTSAYGSIRQHTEEYVREVWRVVPDATNISKTTVSGLQLLVCEAFSY